MLVNCIMEHDKFHEMVRLRQVLRPLRVPVDVLVYSQAEINQSRSMKTCPLRPQNCCVNILMVR